MSARQPRQIKCAHNTQTGGARMAVGCKDRRDENMREARLRRGVQLGPIVHGGAVMLSARAAYRLRMASGAGQKIGRAMKPDAMFLRQGAVAGNGKAAPLGAAKRGHGCSQIGAVGGIIIA